MPELKTETELRAAVIAEAISFLGTPFHHMGRVKGAGVACGTLLACVYETAGVKGFIDCGFFTFQWHLHEREERYREIIERHARLIEGPPQPADIAMWKLGRTYSHAAIVIDWPLIIQAHWSQGVEYANAFIHPQLRGRIPIFFDPFQTP